VGYVKTIDEVFAMIEAVAPEIGNSAQEQAFKEQLKKEMKEMIKEGLV
jgi:hypothetical protein